MKEDVSHGECYNLKFICLPVNLNLYVSVDFNLNAIFEFVQPDLSESSDFDLHSLMFQINFFIENDLK